LSIFGCGGSNPTPFHTPTEYSDTELAGFLDRAYTGVARDQPRLMVCHTPPFDTATDRITNGTHLRRPPVRAFIRPQQPGACLTGQIHESAGVDHIGRTTIVNAGAFRDGGYIVVNAGSGSLDVELTALP